MDGYAFIPFDPKTGHNDGLVAKEGEQAWFDPADPFMNELAIVLGRTGDDYTATVMYAGLPMLLVMAGGTRDERSQYDYSEVIHDDEYRQEIAALFHERVINDLPSYGDAQFENGDWPFDHPASVMVHEVDPEHTEDSRQDVPRVGRYDLYHDLMEFGGSQGYEITDFVGRVAHAMHAAEPNDLPEPRGF